MTHAAIDDRTSEVFFEVPDSQGERVRVLATLVHIREDQTRFGLVEKGLYLAEGPHGRFKVWGTVPPALHRQERPFGVAATLRGSLVELHAIVQRSEPEPCFGFLVRPTRAKVLVWGINGRERGAA